MHEVIVEKPAQKKLEAMGVFNWPVWEKEASIFSWRYDATEICYLLEGEVCVTPHGGQAVYLAAGDMVTFPQGLICIWEVVSTVKKHYLFA